jgi:predicted 3-demethylubiquinone-9 3-methyltransferase (glyoxalase superfamily)
VAAKTKAAKSKAAHANAEKAKAAKAKGTKMPGKVAVKRITPFLWFDDDAEPAAEFYTSLFPDSRITGVHRYGEAGPGEKGTVMLVEFTIAGQEVMAVNGGPEFPQSESFSFHVACKDQAQIDALWARLSEGGQTSVCGWLKDRFGLSWQVNWDGFPRLMKGDPAKGERVMAEALKQTKVDIAALKAAAKGA